jgi:ribonuclease VapC
MIIDTSAMVAILYGEPEAAAFTRLIHDSATGRISVANYLELSMVIEKQLGAEGMRQADAFLRRAAIDIEPVTVEQGHLARQAFLDFGKGRHRAGLTVLPTLSPEISTCRCYSRATISQRQTSVRLHDM